MKQFPLTLVVDVTVTTPPAGLNQYNTSNLAIFTNEQPGSGFSGNFKSYIQPSDVATDFGSSATTTRMANRIFSQGPNILTGGGQLIVIPMKVQVQNLELSDVPASGTFVLSSSNGDTEAINWDDTTDQIQTKIQAVPGQENWMVSGTLADQTLVVTCWGTYGPAPALSATSNSLENGGSVAIDVDVTQAQVGETIGAAITRTKNLVQYFGILTNLTVSDIGQTDVLAAAEVVQALVKIAFWPSYDPNDVQPGGILNLIRTGSFTKSRELFYQDDTDGGVNAVLMAAAYAGRALSVDFQGSNTTLDMDLKTLADTQPDPNIDQTTLDAANAAGADCYISFSQNDDAGNAVGKVFSSGANQFFDQVYNSLWISGALQVEVFNFLSQTSTKITQTEQGMDAYKSVVRQVCLQARQNGYCAPGSWTSPDTFGDPETLRSNVLQVGFYIWSPPVNQQLQSDRVQRKAPPVSIALKEAGSIESANIIVNVNP